MRGCDWDGSAAECQPGVELPAGRNGGQVSFSHRAADHFPVEEGHVAAHLPRQREPVAGRRPHRTRRIGHDRRAVAHVGEAEHVIRGLVLLPSRGAERVKLDPRQAGLRGKLPALLMRRPRIIMLSGSPSKGRS